MFIHAHSWLLLPSSTQPRYCVFFGKSHNWRRQIYHYQEANQPWKKRDIHYCPKRGYYIVCV